MIIGSVRPGYILTRVAPSQGRNSLIVEKMINPVIIGRDLSKSTGQPLKLLPTKSERIASRKSTNDTAGPAWFNMRGSDKTVEVQKDIRLLSMRSVLDPKRHYRKGESLGSSNYAQVGTVITDATGHYSDRLTKRQRTLTVLDSLVKDQNREQYFKNKYNRLQQVSQRSGKGAYKGKFAGKPWIGKHGASGKTDRRGDERKGGTSFSIDD